MFWIDHSKSYKRDAGSINLQTHDDIVTFISCIFHFTSYISLKTLGGQKYSFIKYWNFKNGDVSMFKKE